MPAAEGDVPVTRQRRRWTWTFFSAVLITLGALLAPVAILANWTQVELQDTDAFVTTFAPLAHDPEVQTYLADQTTTLILKKVDVDAITSQLVSGVSTSINLPPRASAALGALGGLAAQSAKTAIGNTVTRFVHSKAFATVFERTLRVTHRQLTATLQGKSNAVISTSKGTIGLEIGPIVAAVKTYMVKQGIGIAAVIPTVNRTVVLVESTQLATLQVAYAVTVTVGTWIPFVVLLLLIGGVLLATRRRTALIWAAAALAFTALLVVIAIDLGKVFAIQALAATVLPPGVVTVVFTQVTAFTRSSAVVVVFAAVVVLLAAWFGRRTGLPARLRAAGDSAATSIRSAGEKRGITTGEFGRWLHSARRVIRYLIAVIAAAIVLFVRPLTAEVILSTSLVSLLALLLVELLQRPTGSEAPETPETPVAVVPVVPAVAAVATTATATKPRAPRQSAAAKPAASKPATTKSAATKPAATTKPRPDPPRP